MHKQSPLMSLTAANPTGLQSWAPFMGADPKTVLALSPIHPCVEQDFETSLVYELKLQEPNVPGCLGLHEGEGVRTVRRLHPG